MKNLKKYFFNFCSKYKMLLKKSKLFEDFSVVLNFQSCTNLSDNNRAINRSLKHLCLILYNLN